MKKILALVVVGAIALSASADSINFKWVGSDGDATAADTIITSVGDGTQLSAIISGNTVQLADLQSLTWLDALAVQVIPSFLGGGVDTPSLTVFDQGYATQTGVGIIVNGGSSYTSILDVKLGDTFDLTTGRVFSDAGVTPGVPENLTMSPEGVTITVIPEPATLGLMGVAGLGMFLARRKARR